MKSSINWKKACARVCRAPAQILAGVVLIYQRLISPIMPMHCRFWPTCSEYSHQALLNHGVIRGSLLSIWRIVRCNGLFSGGIDQISANKRKN